MRPRDVLDDRNLDRAEVVVAEAALLRFGPCKAGLVKLEDVCEQLEFLWPEEVVAIEFQVLQPFCGEMRARRELGQMRGMRQTVWKSSGSEAGMGRTLRATFL